jgi:5-methylcytosine-specific restriction endonuclease McrA
MAIRISKRCKRCGAIHQNKSGYCDECTKYINKQNDKGRATASERGYSGSWKTFSQWYLSNKEHQQCAICGAKATVTDHKAYPAPVFKELYGDNFNSFYNHQELFQPLCQSCNLKKAKQDRLKLDSFNSFKKVKDDFFV